MRRPELEREFRDLFTQVTSLFFEDGGMFSFEAIDCALVELSNLLQRRSRFGVKSPEVDAVLSLESGWSALVKIEQN